jgi:hypothetical protein
MSAPVALNIAVAADGGLHVVGEIPDTIHVVADLIHDADGSQVSVDEDLVTFHTEPVALTYRIVGPHPFLTGVLIGDRIVT